jgi:hypothetical protein
MRIKKSNPLRKKIMNCVQRKQNPRTKRTFKPNNDPSLLFSCPPCAFLVSWHRIQISNFSKEKKREKGFMKNPRSKAAYNTSILPSLKTSKPSQNCIQVHGLQFVTNSAAIIATLKKP